MQEQPKVVARLTATRADRTRLIVEVQQDATFFKFYHFYRQVGDDASTKTKVRVANRNEGVYPHYRASRVVCGLYKIGERLSKGIAGYKTMKITILDADEYERLISAAPDELGLARTVSPFEKTRTWERGIHMAIPAFGYTPLKKRFEIITGR